MENNGNRLPILEALILSSPEPLPVRKIAEIVQDITPTEISKAVDELNNRYLTTDASFRIRKVANGYQFFVTENYAGYVEELFTRKKTQRLTRAALETLAIIAYRQPVTRVDIEMIRGVSSDSAIRTLLERKFITLAGRAKTIGRPLLYSTTDEFLKYFGLDSLGDLPRMEEIEELLSAREPDSQQSLSLEAVESLNRQEEDDDIDSDENEDDELESLELGESEESSDEIDELAEPEMEYNFDTPVEESVADPSPEEEETVNRY